MKSLPDDQEQQARWTQELQEMKDLNVNCVRLPFGYWVLDLPELVRKPAGPYEGERAWIRRARPYDVWEYVRPAATEHAPHAPQWPGASRSGRPAPRTSTRCSSRTRAGDRAPPAPLAHRTPRVTPPATRRPSRARRGPLTEESMPAQVDKNRLLNKAAGQGDCGARREVRGEADALRRQ